MGNLGSGAQPCWESNQQLPGLQKSPIRFNTHSIILRALTPALALIFFFLVLAVFLVCIRLSGGLTKGHPSCIADALEKAHFGWGLLGLEEQRGDGGAEMG